MPAIGPRAAVSAVETGFTIDTDAGAIALQMTGIVPRVRRALRAEEAILEAQVLARAKEIAAQLSVTRTGAYIASIQGGVFDTATGDVTARIWSGEPVASILEFGASIPAHDIAADNARALHFHGGFFHAFLRGDVFAARVHVPGAVIAPRPALHQALDEMKMEIVQGLIDAGAGKVDEFEF
jgi:hypothetical protein